LVGVVDNDIVDTGMSCVDLVVLVDTGSNYKVLSIKRGRPPFVGMWATPGGNIDEDEIPLDAAIRELHEETGLLIHPRDLTYVGAFDKEF
jgi:8-oxo-dGTP diphosphatase